MATTFGRSGSSSFLFLTLLCCGSEAGSGEQKNTSDGDVDTTSDAASTTDSALSSPSCNGTHLVYLNRQGGTYTPGPNDAMQNVSTLIQTTVNAPTFTGSSQIWNETVACIQTAVAPFDIKIVENDPGTPHNEIVFSGTPGTWGFGAGGGGVSPSGCDPMANSIALVFAESFATSSEELCRLALFNIGALSALGISYGCPDAMTYLDCEDPVTFSDQSLPCGILEPTECECTGLPNQNSYQSMLSVYGPCADPQ